MQECLDLGKNNRIPTYEFQYFIQTSLWKSIMNPPDSAIFSF